MRRDSEVRKGSSFCENELEINHENDIGTQNYESNLKKLSYRNRLNSIRMIYKKNQHAVESDHSINEPDE